MAKKNNKNRKKDKINCPGESYLIEREMCLARRKRGYKYCARCPENTDETFLFESPRQVREPKKKTAPKERDRTLRKMRSTEYGVRNAEE